MGKIRYCNVEVEDLCLDIGSELMAVFSSFYKPSSSLVVPKCSSSRHLLEANDRRILKQKPNFTLQLQQAMEFGFWKTEEAENFFISNSQGEWNIVLTSKGYASHEM